MKRLALVMLSLAFVLCACSGSGGETSIPAAEPPAALDPNPYSRTPIPEGTEYISNLHYENPGAMGDNDGPAVVIYSEQGYNKAEMEVALSQIDIHNIRSDGRVVAGYIFLGLTVYAPWGWMNSVDAGLVWSGRVGGWRLFYSSYDPKVWWHSTDVFLDPDKDYKIVLDSSEADGQVKLSVYDMDGGLADSADIVLNNALADGSNTAFYMNFAIDSGTDLQYDRSGNPTDDWEEIILYSTDDNIYMQNILISNAALYNSGEKVFWNEENTDRLSIWPSKKHGKVDYEVTRVFLFDGYSDYRIDLDMNRSLPGGTE